MDGRGWPARLADTALVAVAAVALAPAFDAVGLPSPALFGGLSTGLVRGLAGRRRPALPEPATTAGQGLAGTPLARLLLSAPLLARWLRRSLG